MKYLIEDKTTECTPAEDSRLARKLLARLLRDQYGITPLPAIARTPPEGVGGMTGGKPYFPEHPEIRFSLSHCRSAVMAVVADREVGCDIEDIVDSVTPELLEAAMNRDERRRIETAPDPCREFTLLWTRKEAGVKREGLIPDDPRQWPSVPPDSSITILSAEHTPTVIFSITL